MKSIYKYPLDRRMDRPMAGPAIFKISVPRWSEILTIQLQNEVPCIWAMVDKESPAVKGGGGTDRNLWDWLGDSRHQWAQIHRHNSDARYAGVSCFRKATARMKTLIISRRKWLRGDNGDASQLRVTGGKMCCLGFLGLACGLKKAQILDADSPETVDRSLWDKWSKGMITRGINSALCQEMMDTNDTMDLEEEFRETKLKKLFKRIGYKVEFKG